MIRLIDPATTPWSSFLEIMRSNPKYYMDIDQPWMQLGKPNWIRSNVFVEYRRIYHLDDTVCFGYFDDNDKMTAFGRFSRWGYRESWSLTHIFTMKGISFPRTYGGKSSDVVYDILNFATEFFENEGRIQFWMMEPDHPDWETLVSNDHTFIKQRYDKNETVLVKHPKGHIMVPPDLTFIHDGTVKADARILHFVKRKTDV